MNNQLTQSMKQWNDEEDLIRWEKFYQENSYHGNRLRSRESKSLEFLDYLKLSPNSKVLELGYGAGLTSAKIYKRGYNVTGVDISTPLCDLAIKNCEKVSSKGKFEFKVGNVENLEFSENYFDCVVGIGFLQYLEFPTTCLKEAYRVLKPGGYLIIAQRNMYGFSSLDGPFKWLRSLVYFISNRRYELRWQDTFLLHFLIFFTSLGAPFIRSMKKKKLSLIQHKKIGLVKKNAISYNRLRKMIKKSGFHILRSAGAGYLTKKSIISLKLARKIDFYLQKMNDLNKVKWIKKRGNSVVFLAQKRK